ncbi:MAG TPA: tetratricopeptide repeat protein [Longimicrobium sp.]|jgi:tetratricopeptide (TPR) repeat protein
MNRRRTSEAELPHAPLEFAYPLAVPGPGAEAECVLVEVPTEHALLVLRTLRLVHAWTRGPDAVAAIFRRETLDAWEEALIADPFDGADGLWAPLAVIAGEVRRPERADPTLIAQACLSASDWALGVRAERTALLWAEAAALARPSNARYAWIAGRLARNQSRLREAELWLRRAARVAAWAGDWETQDLAFNTLGNLHAHQGAYDRALRYLTRALTLAKRRRMTDREGAVSHDLFVVLMTTGDLPKAEVHALRAYDLYGADHPNLRRLAYDIAHLWAEQGRFTASLPVLNALAPHFPEPDLELRVRAATARAAGAEGRVAEFTAAWQRAWELVRDHEAEMQSALPSILIDLGRGAASLGAWAQATQALNLALERAQEQGVNDAAVDAELLLAMVRRHERAEVSRPVPLASAARHLSAAFVRSLSMAKIE